MSTQLTHILNGYLKIDKSINYLRLEDIPQFKQFFCEYLQEKEHITAENLDGVFERWCRQLSSGRAFPDIRRFAVYGLWFRCELKKYHIARLLGVSTRTIRRDMRVIEKQLFR